MSQLLTASTIMQCPHFGAVQATSGNGKVRVVGDFVLRGSDVFTIVGCPFATPAGTPHPCVSVVWSAPVVRSKAVGDAPLTDSSVGWCLAGDRVVQGTVQTAGVQPSVSGL